MLYEIVHEEPAALTGLRTGVPVELEFIVGECLAKDRDDRTGTAQEVSRKLRTLAEKLKSGHSTILRTSNLTAGVPATMTGAPTLNPAETLPADAMVVRKRTWRAVYGLAAILGVALLGVLAVHFTEVAPDQPLRRFSFVPPPDLNATPIYAGLAISPNGRHLAFTTVGADGGLWVQDLDQDEPRQLAGTEGAYLPFWSPDSEYIVFPARGELRQISVQGGASSLVCSLPVTFYQGTWSPDGESIVFASRGGSAAVSSLFEVSSQGGSPEELISPADVGENLPAASRPAFVSSGTDRILVFTVGDGSATTSTMYAKNLDTGQTAALRLGDRSIYSAATGHLIYQSDRNAYNLWARPFSPETLEFTGPQFPLRQNARQPSLSDDGTLAFLDGPDAGARTLVWRDRAGELLETIGQPQPGMFNPTLSPDGQRIAVRSIESGNFDIWIHDLIHSINTRLTFDDRTELVPTWSPSGGEIAYSLADTAGSSLMSKSANGTGEAIVLVDADDFVVPTDWSTDGRYLVYQERTSGTDFVIRYVEFQSDGEVSEPVTFLATPAGEGYAMFSPDGRFVAYMSNESGSRQIYVRPFPDGPGKWQVSVNGGVDPRWRSDGKELYYHEGNTLMAVSVSTESTFTRGQPQQLFESPDLFAGQFAQYDVSADGERFVTVAPAEDRDEEAAPPKIRVVENWYEEFREHEQ